MASSQPQELPSRTSTGSVAATDAASQDVQRHTLKLAGRARHVKELAGVLHVRCVGATGLPKRPSHIKEDGRYHLSTAPGVFDPYAVLTLSDTQGNSSSRRTHTISKTCDPTWREEFKFGVRKQSRNLELRCVIHEEDQVHPEDAAVAEATISLEDLVQSQDRSRRRVWLTHELPLQSKEQPLADSLGVVTIKVKWDPWEAYSCGSLKAVCRSSQALTLIGSGLACTAGNALLVATHARWACKGPHLPHCTAVPVPGASASALVACGASFVVTLFQFLGGLGVLGRGSWNAGPPSVLDILDDPDDCEEGDTADESSLSLVVKTESLGLFDYSMTVGLDDRDIIPSKAKSTTLTAMRFVSWLCQVLALVMAGLAMSLVNVRDSGAETFMAESCYLTLSSIVMLMTAGLLFSRASVLGREDHEWSITRKWVDLRRLDAKGSKADAQAIAPGFTNVVKKLHQIQKDFGRVQDTFREKVMEAKTSTERKTREAARAAGLTLPLLGGLESESVGASSGAGRP